MSAARGGPASSSAPGPQGVRVLVVDDDRVCLTLVSKMLQSCEYTVTSVHCASAALELLRQDDAGFDLVLSDVYMPDMDGFKLLEIIGLEMDLPVIMMSANGETPTILRGVTHGAVDFLIKPVRVEELRTMWQHVERRRQDQSGCSIEPPRPKSRSQARAQQPDTHNQQQQQPLQLKEQPPQQQAQQQQQLHTQQEQAGTDHLHEEGLDHDAEEAGGSGRKRKGDLVVAAPQQRPQDPIDAALDAQGTSKKPRVVWSAEMHQQFVTAVNRLGVDKAVPKKILELMGAEGKLTRENVASHLQKYRLALKRVSQQSQPGVAPGSVGGGQPTAVAMLAPTAAPVAAVAVAAVATVGVPSVVPSVVVRPAVAAVTPPASGPSPMEL